MGPPYMMSCWNLGFDLACKFLLIVELPCIYTLESDLQLLLMFVKAGTH